MNTVLYDPLMMATASGARRADGGVCEWGNAGYGLGYDAVKPKGRRSMPLGRVLSEDQELRQLPRRQLTTSVRDLNRNFAIAAWMIRRHLDYVSTFHFRSKTGNRDLDNEVEDFMKWWSHPTNCDPAGRHSLRALHRMWEMRAVIDGDVLVNRLADGRIQTVEGDRIQTMGGIPFAELGIHDPTWVVNGVWTNQNGRAISYMVFKRRPSWTGLVFDRAVSGRFADLHGYFDRYDQVRGISPLAAAHNTLRDVYEGLDYALVKAKVSQLFALAAYREGSEQMGDIEQREGEVDPNADPNKPRYDINFDQGPAFVDLDAGDRLEILESKNPSTEFQGFTNAMIMIALKALDIPYSFFDESHTNYSGARMAGVQFYEAATIPKRERLKILIDKNTRWRLGLAVADGDITLPAGMQASDLKFEWEHAGVPLYDPLKEISASIAAINGGLSSEIREARRLGLDFFRLIDERAEAQAYAKQKGVVISTALPAIALDDPNNSRTKTEDENIDEDQKPKNGRSKILWP